MRLLIKFTVFASVILLFVSCNLFEAHTFDRMNQALERHIKWQDEEDSMQSQIELVNTLSYDTVNDADTVYIARVYLVAKSWPIGGSRVYNTNDTISVYYDQNMKVLKMEAIK